MSGSDEKKPSEFLMKSDEEERAEIIQKMRDLKEQTRKYVISYHSVQQAMTEYALKGKKDGELLNWANYRAILGEIAHDVLHNMPSTNSEI